MAEQTHDAADVVERRDRIASAAERCFERWGVRRTRMEDIATEAGLARPVLYRYFDSKEQLQLVVMLRHIIRRADELHTRLPPAGPSGELILRALISGIAEAPGDYVSESVLGVDVVHDTATLVARSSEIEAAMQSYWEPYLLHAESRGELRDGVEIADAIRWLTQIVFRFLAVPELVSTRDELEHQLATFVVPAIIRSSGS